jgi:hypothetical protein
MSDINREELAICKRRGHDPVCRQTRWMQCMFCGVWLREVRTIEEREDTPPESEQDPFNHIRIQNAQPK